MEEVIIIGGSAAATGAAINLARQGIKFKIVCQSLGGEVINHSGIQNFPGFLNISGLDLMKRFIEHLELYNVKIKEGVVIEKIKEQDGFFVLFGKKGEEQIRMEARTIIIATGSRPRRLEVPREEFFLHKGLSYCSLCDGPLFRNKKVAVVGSGNSACEAAYILSRYAQEVHILSKYPQIKGDEFLIQRLKNTPNVKILAPVLTQKILGEEFVRGLEYQDLISGENEIIEVEGVFVYVGMIPNSEFISEVEKNEKGEIKTNSLGETSLPGIFAAGDVTDIPFKQLAIAVGQGAVAAFSVISYLGKLTRVNYGGEG